MLVNTSQHLTVLLVGTDDKADHFFTFNGHLDIFLCEVLVLVFCNSFFKSICGYQYILNTGPISTNTLQISSLPWLLAL